MFKKEEIIELFKSIALPFKDFEGGPKLDKIIEICGKMNIPCEYIKDKGLFINKCKKPKIMIISHIDLIGKFRKGFAENKICEIIDSNDPDNKSKKELIIGGLDNTITNAVGILVIKELLKNHSDITLFLSIGEEVGSTGVKNYLKAKKNASNTFYINLDVTNEGWNKNGSVEYDKPNFYILNQLKEILKDNNIFFTGERVGDDIDAVNRFDCQGFSYCLPTKDTIHSYKNKAITDTLVPYAEALYKMVNELKFEESCVSDFRSYYFEQVINYSKEEFKKFLEERKTMESRSMDHRQSSFDFTYYGGNPFGMEGYEFEDDTSYQEELEPLYIGSKNPFDNNSEKINDILIANLDFGNSDSIANRISSILSIYEIKSEKIYSFIYDKLNKMEEFTLDELESVCKTWNKYGELELSRQLISDFRTERIVKEIKNNVYIFNLDN